MPRLIGWPESYIYGTTAATLFAVVCVAVGQEPSIAGVVCVGVVFMLARQVALIADAVAHIIITAEGDEGDE